MKLWVSSMVLMGVLTFQVSKLQAQVSFPPASMNAEMVVDLGEEPLQSDYLMNLAHITFKDAIAAERFCKSMKDNLVSCQYDVATGTAQLHLALEHAQPGWGIEEWEAYFLSVSQRYRDARDYFNE